jgi:hypothetical protein
MPFCPLCNKKFKTNEKVARHMSQPRSSCVHLINDFVSISLAPDTSQSQNISLGPGLADDIDMNLHGDFTPQGDTDIEIGSSNSGSFHNAAGTTYREEFAGAAQEWGVGETFMDKFDLDDFAELRKKNLYYPFALKDDWEMAAFLLRSGMSMALIDDFLTLQLVSTFSCVAEMPFLHLSRFAVYPFRFEQPRR